MTIAILYRKELKEYDFGPGHPFSGDRYQLFHKFLAQKLKPEGHYKILKADWATDEDLMRICQRDYINFTKQYYSSVNLGLEGDGDFFQYHSLDNLPVGRPGKVEEAARLVIGQAKLAADLVQSGKYQKAVSIGGGLHHAKRASGEGFCLYNDVAFTAIYLMERYHLKRVLILDTDAHDGNGTSEYFYSDPRVLFIDVHQDPRTIYPGTGFASEIGAGEGIGKTVNIPLPADAGNDSYKLAFKEIIEPLTAEFKPEIIIRNGGSDPHFNDGLTSLGLTVAGFEMIGQRVKEMSTLCEGKVIDLIASGYHPGVLPYAWMALISGLADFGVPIEEPSPIPASLRTDAHLPDTQEVIDEVKSYLRDYWHCLQ
jgi:acetoin utilization protein AcuC